MNITSKKFKSIAPKQLNSALVVEGDINYAIKVWKRILKDADTIQECYDRKFYRKPSAERRLVRQLAVYNQSKDVSNE